MRWGSTWQVRDMFASSTDPRRARAALDSAPQRVWLLIQAGASAHRDADACRRRHEQKWIRRLPADPRSRRELCRYELVPLRRRRN